MFIKSRVLTCDIILRNHLWFRELDENMANTKEHVLSWKGQTFGWVLYQKSRVHSVAAALKLP